MPLGEIVVETLPIPERLYEKPSAPKAKIPRPKKLDLATINAIRSILNAIKKTYRKRLEQCKGVAYEDLPTFLRDIKIAEEFLGRQA